MAPAAAFFLRTAAVSRRQGHGPPCERRNMRTPAQRVEAHPSTYPLQPEQVKEMLILRKQHFSFRHGLRGHRITWHGDRLRWRRLSCSTNCRPLGFGPVRLDCSSTVCLALRELAYSRQAWKRNVSTNALCGQLSVNLNWWCMFPSPLTHLVLLFCG